MKKDNSLEEKIIKSVYKYEKKRTLKDILLYGVSIMGFSILIIYITSLILLIYYQQDTLAVLQLFKEDFSVIQMYFGEVMSTLYIEAPKEMFIILFTAIIVLSVLLYFGYKNFEKIRNKLKVIYRKPKKN